MGCLYSQLTACETLLPLCSRWAQSAATPHPPASQHPPLSLLFSQLAKFEPAATSQTGVATSTASLYWPQRVLWLMIQTLKRPTTATGLIIPFLSPSSGLNCHSNWDEVTRNFNGPRVSLAENYFLRSYHQFIWKMLLTGGKNVNSAQFLNVVPTKYMVY